MQVITCYQCRELISPRGKDFRAGEYQCKCGHVNSIAKTEAYDENVLLGLPSYGTLVYIDNPNKCYFLNSLKNEVGRGEGCNVRLDRFEHNGKCYISSYHCTITIGFDNLSGKIRYQVSDGVEQENGERKYSTNGTMVNHLELNKNDKLLVPENGIINLGGADEFRINPVIIPQETLENYKINVEHVDMTE